MRRLLLVLVCCSAPVAAQLCSGATETFLSNDNLPQIPSGLTAVSVIQGLCEGEACGAVFNVGSPGQAFRVNLASVGYFSSVGANGITAAADLEFYDGVTFSGPNGMVATLGPQLFSWSTATSTSIQLTSHAINVSQDLTSFNIVASSGKLVCVWWMDFNPLGGSCPTGYPINFGTDNSSFQFSCTAAVTPPQRNLIYIQGQGWRDASKAVVGGFPLCPLFYSGNWVMRVCVEPTTPPATLTVFGHPTPPPAFFPVNMEFKSLADPGVGYIALASLGNSPGIPWPPFGVVPLNDDFVLQFLIPDVFEQPGAPTNILIGFTGLLSPAGTAYGTFYVPPVTGFTLYFAFVTVNGRISNSASVSF